MNIKKLAIQPIVFSIIILLACRSTVAAQGSNRCISLGKNSTWIDNLLIADSIMPGKGIAYTAEFDIIPNDALETKLILNELFSSCLQKKTIAQLMTSRVNTNMEAMEERYWKNVTISLILFPEMDAASRELVKIRIKIKAVSATVKFDSKTKINISKKEQQRLSFKNAYRLNAGRLPGIRVSKISTLNIEGNTGEPVSFLVELQTLDSKEWMEWFMNGAGGVQKEQMTLELLEPDMRSVITAINLGDLEIISYSSIYNSNQPTIQRNIVGLQTRNFSINTSR